MNLRAKDIIGLCDLPTTKKGILGWLRNSAIDTVTIGNHVEFHLSDLPADVRLAYVQRQLAGLNLEAGTYDEAAHMVFMEAAPPRRARAARKAEIAADLLAMGKLMPWAERVVIIQRKYGKKGTSKPRLMALLNMVQGVDPINFAPALLDNNILGPERREITPKAWQFFMTLIAGAGPEWPLVSAWRDVRDVAQLEGWYWPSYITVWRRWQELPEAQRQEARHGTAAAVKTLSMPALRDKTSISALEWVSLDGRTQDFWVDAGDGRAIRPIMLALIDVASNKVLDFELALSENAAGTVRLIKRTCETYGVFDRLYTDNGSAFAGHLVAGGNPFKFRNAKTVDAVQPLGICKIMGINLTFALPANAQAKIAERTFATLSRVIDDRPEFKGAHAGHKAGASPDAKVTPVPIDLAMSVIQREIKRHNSEGGRRSQGARGRSYDQVFAHMVQSRAKRQPTMRQLYLAGLVWKPVSVDRLGRIVVNGWTYGEADTQEKLLRFHGKDQQILLGRDPYDFSAPAIAYDAAGHFICEGIIPVARGAYDSLDGIRKAAQNRKAARAAVQAAAVANDYLADQEFKALLAKLDESIAAKPDVTVRGNGLLAPNFKTPLRSKAKPKADDNQVIPADYLKIMDTALAAKMAQRG